MRDLPGRLTMTYAEAGHDGTTVPHTNVSPWWWSPAMSAITTWIGVKPE